MPKDYAMKHNTTFTGYIGLRNGAILDRAKTTFDTSGIVVGGQA